MKTLFSLLALCLLPSLAFAAEQRGRLNRYDVEVCHFEWNSYFHANKITVYTNGWTVNLCFIDRARSSANVNIYKCNGVAFGHEQAEGLHVVYERSSKKVSVALRNARSMDCEQGRPY